MISLSSETATIGAALIAALVAILVNFITRRHESKKAAAETLRQRKMELYDELSRFLGENLYNSIYGKRNEKDFEKGMFILNHRSIVWMSDEVLRSYIAFRNSTFAKKNVDELEALTVISSYSKFLETMRKDCGHENIGIDQYDLMKLLNREKVL